MSINFAQALARLNAFRLFIARALPFPAHSGNLAANATGAAQAMPLRRE